MALDFNGSTQYLRRTSTPITGQPITLCAWYRYDTAIGAEAELAVLGITDADAAQEMTIEIGNTGGTDYAIAMINAGGTVGFAVSSTPPTINTWQHLLGTYSSTSRRDVYLNGSNVGNDTTSATPSGISDIMIGAISSSSSIIKYFNGAIAEAAAWSVVLSAAEITSLSKGISPLKIRPQSLECYVPMIREVVDLMGGIFTNTNTAVAFPHPRMYY